MSAADGNGGKRSIPSSLPPVPATLDDLIAVTRELVREQSRSRKLLAEVVDNQAARDRQLDRRMDSIMELLKEALSR